MNNNSRKPPVKALSRERFLGSVYLTELVLLLISLGVTRLATGHFFVYGFRPSAENILLGLLSALPLAFLILLITLGPVSRIGRIAQSMDRIARRLKAVLGSSIHDLTAVDIVLLSAAAGVAEELFFRGLLQAYLGVAGAALVFGLMHALTPAYFLLATAIGLYLGYLYEAGNNLLIPMLGHAAYDVFALYLLRWQFTRRP